MSRTPMVSLYPPLLHLLVIAARRKRSEIILGYSDALGASCPWNNQLPPPCLLQVFQPWKVEYSQAPLDRNERGLYLF